MSRAEKFIEERTKKCSNLAHFEDLNGNVWEENTPWLTLDQARKAVEIAREEMIEKFICWLEDNFRDDAGLCCIISDFDTTKEMYNDLKNTMKDE